MMAKTKRRLRWPKDYIGWVIVAPDRPLIQTVRRRRSDTIRAFFTGRVPVAIAWRGAWADCRHQGYRCVRVKLLEVKT